MTRFAPEVVDRVALGIAQEIGWGTFSHFDPNDMRRISRAALEASGHDKLVRALEAIKEHFDGAARDKDWNETERVVRLALMAVPTPDRGGEADEARSGSAEGESGLPEGPSKPCP